PRRVTMSRNPVQHGLHSLDAYRVALEFCGRVAKIGLGAHLGQQLNRAAESVVLNIGEAHPARGADRARRFRIAADEASECVAALDVLEIRESVSPSELAILRELLDRECAMLYRLSRKR